MTKPDLRAGLASTAKAMEDAAALYRSGRRDDAETICTRILKAHPSHFDAMHLLGLLKLDDGKPAAALRLLEAAAKATPNAPQLLSNLGRALSALNRDDEALAVIDRSLTLAPESFESLNIRGN